MKPTYINCDGEKIYQGHKHYDQVCDEFFAMMPHSMSWSAHYLLNRE